MIGPAVAIIIGIKNLIGLKFGNKPTRSTRPCRISRWQGRKMEIKCLSQLKYYDLSVS
jgi:hypothetical protein